MGRIKTLTALAIVGAVVLLATSAQAVVLPNFNTLVFTSANNSTITQWTVDGIDQYIGGNGSWYYRVGGAGPLISFDSLPIISPPVQTGPPVLPFDFSPTTIQTTYGDAANGIQFTLKYSVFGGDAGSNASTIQAQLTAQLTGQSAATALSIYEFNDLAVNDTEINDIVMPSLLNPGDKVNQSDPVTIFGESATSKLTGPGAALVASDPSHREAGFAGAVFADLNSGSLNDTPPGGVAIGPGNVAYAYQYDFTLASGTPSESVEVDLLRNLSAAPATSGAVPEPISATLSLLGLAVLGGLAGGRRSKLA